MNEQRKKRKQKKGKCDSMSAMQWFYSFIKKYKFRLFIALVLVTVTSALAIINPYISGMLIDDVIEGGMHSLLPK